MSHRMLDTNVVKKQYENDQNLSIRISIHQKYSVNQQGFSNWIAKQYELPKGGKVLELGCGNGEIWKDNLNRLKDCQMILSDFSEGMLAAAKTNLPSQKNLSFEQIDIQAIPYEDASFDVVIANMMLHHVPDLNVALSEVKRVLKPNGIFYTAVPGEQGIHNYLSDVLKEYGILQKMMGIFTMQNGYPILQEVFPQVELREYEDALEVTDTNDLVEYLYSMASIVDLKEVSREMIYDLFEQQKNDQGSIHVPKEYGLLIAKNFCANEVVIR